MNQNNNFMQYQWFQYDDISYKNSQNKKQQFGRPVSYE